MARAQSPLGFALGIAAALLLGAGVLAMMIVTRGETERAPATAAQAQLDPPPPPLPPPPAAGDAEPLIPAPYLDGRSEAPPSAVPPLPARANSEEAASRLAQHWRAPSLVVELGAAPVGPATATPPTTVRDTAAKGDPDLEFARRITSEAGDSAHATTIAAPSLTAPQGVILSAVLETAINSDLPGFVRAVVSRDVRAFDGETLIIPRGSKLVGQYRSGVAAGQSRAFVVWSRLIRPDGATIDLVSPGADPLGQAGLQGETERHFFRRFGAATLLSVLNTGLGALAGPDRNRIIIGSSQDASRVAEIALQKQIDIPPTIRVAQGTPIRVFVARDLVFGTGAQ